MSGFYTKPYELYKDRLEKAKSEIKEGEKMNPSDKGELKRRAYRDARAYNNAYRKRYLYYRQEQGMPDWKAENQAEIDIAEMIDRNKI